MRIRLLISVGALLVCAPLAAHAASPVQIGTWVTEAGDTFIVDTAANVGYLVHSDGRFASFPVVTGQQRTMSFIGKTYYAATPSQRWMAGSNEVKDDFVMFGKTGRFIRLFDASGKKTSYGIHGHRDADQMLAEEKRYRSYGCIIVSEEVLNVMEREFLELDGFPVITQRGAPDLSDKPATTAAGSTLHS